MLEESYLAPGIRPRGDHHAPSISALPGMLFRTRGAPLSLYSTVARRAARSAHRQRASCCAHLLRKMCPDLGDSSVQRAARSRCALHAVSVVQPSRGVKRAACSVQSQHAARCGQGGVQLSSWSSIQGERRAPRARAPSAKENSDLGILTSMYVWISAVDKTKKKQSPRFTPLRRAP